ncbi:NAD(P)-dependent oxidoreductase [Aureitalea marina]|uniref:Alanine dehydrogenase n=1 Tax=Aureitalea marina TaxID=930804 RepID=A0A2S7KTP8_9FLAO|nr:NAD(P)-dependent oxidoreductase [Aureitalea marina]PQB06012.1 alanine dehydrogenase [Aureitalea marina]
MTFALIKERKTPPDRRVVFSPEACQSVIEQYPDSRILVESSDIRVYHDEVYEQRELTVSDDVSSADVMLGVKEVPVESLVPGKKYFFFSHTIKKQPYNRDLLRAILDKKIELYDHETIENERGGRLIGFGYYAGLVGAYNGLRMYGLKEGLFVLPKAEDLPDLSAMKEELDHIQLPAIRIVLTGSGKVMRGAKEILDHIKLKEVGVADYLKENFSEAVYTVADVDDYNLPPEGQNFDRSAFYGDPTGYRPNFMPLARRSDVFIAGHFYGDGAPFLFTREDARQADFAIRYIADISCDIDGPVASTIRPSTIAEPFYGYNPQSESETDYEKKGSIAVMAVDNLPCELPKDASDGFGAMFLKEVIPAFFDGDSRGILHRARITNEEGKLTPRFSYLQDFVDGKE